MHQIPSPRKERERQLRRDAILKAAQAEFAERGFGRAKLEDIARRAEFGKGTLYNYFKGGKRSMLFAIFDELYDDMIQLIDSHMAPEIISRISFRKAFYDYTVSCLSFYLEQRELFLILVKEAHRLCFGEDRDNVDYFRHQRDRVVAALTGPIRHAMQSGEIRVLDPAAVAHMMLGNIQGLQVHMILAADDCDRDEAPSLLTPEEAASFLTTMLLDGLQHRP